MKTRQQEEIVIRTDDTLTVIEFTVDGNTYPAGETASIANVGDITIAEDGSYTFTPVEGFDGEVPPIEYTITDGELTDSGNLNLSVNPAQEPVVNLTTKQLRIHLRQHPCNR